MPNAMTMTSSLREGVRLVDSLIVLPPEGIWLPSTADDGAVSCKAEDSLRDEGTLGSMRTLGIPIDFPSAVILSLLSTIEMLKHNMEADHEISRTVKKLAGKGRSATAILSGIVKKSFLGTSTFTG